jgi:hypothetical protein
VKHFVESVKLQKEQILFLLLDGHSSHSNKDYFSCYSMYKRTSDAMLNARLLP